MIELYFVCVECGQIHISPAGEKPLKCQTKDCKCKEFLQGLENPLKGGMYQKKASPKPTKKQEG